MSLLPTGPGKGRYIIRAKDEGQLADLLGTISADPAISVIDAIGPAGKPHTIVAEMSHDTARFLEQRFQIEPDRPLSLFQ
jgi:hypothetical protein